LKRLWHVCWCYKKTTCLSLFVLILLVVIGVLAPVLIKYHLNHNIFRDMGNYTGRVEDVDVHWISGSYRLEDLVLWRKGGNTEVPFFRVADLSIGLSWDAILNGAILASVVAKNAELNFLDAERADERQTGTGTNWLDVLEELLPTTLHRVEIHNGRMTFQNFDTDPKIDIRAEKINALVNNLTNVKDRDGRRVATARLDARVLEGAPLTAQARFDPFDFNDFVFAAEMHEIDLTRINDLASNYAKVDFASGHGSIFVELTARDGKLSGYIKPLLEDVNVASWEQDIKEQGDNPLRLLWEGAVGFVKTLFTNAESKQIATQIEVEGTLDETKIKSWGAVLGVVRNAFVEAVEARFEEMTPLTRPKKDKEEKETEKDDGKGGREKGRKKNEEKS
jgi:Domain of Unknown Function (DUF748).